MEKRRLRVYLIPLLLSMAACNLQQDSRGSTDAAIVEDFSPDSLYFFVKSRRIEKIEDFLNHPDLPQAYRENFLPLKDAITLQPAALDCPRVLSYGQSSSLVFSFNCGELSSDEEPGQPNNHLEMVFHNKEISQAQTYSLNFASHAVELHGPNPELCMECHTENDKPHIRGLNKQAFNDQEWAAFRELVRSSSKNPRYIRYRSFNWEQENTFSRLGDFIQKEWGR
ncbi:MAG: hypothetical protein KA116_05745 [Proteobacteria bacterium]|nr:hypothetical protein [Pseudomonadota bacterium]